MKFVDGLMIHTGEPKRLYVDTAVRHVLGIKVKIMLPHDPQGKVGPKKPLPDHIAIVEPKEAEVKIEHPYSTCVEKVVEQPPQPVM